MKTLSINSQILKNAYLVAFKNHKKIVEGDYYPSFQKDYLTSISTLVDIELLIEELTDLTIDEFLKLY
jgi:hypothetical protein